MLTAVRSARGRRSSDALAVVQAARMGGGGGGGGSGTKAPPRGGEATGALHDARRDETRIETKINEPSGSNAFGRREIECARVMFQTLEPPTWRKVWGDWQWRRLG
jgi:hypothetical protein